MPKTLVIETYRGAIKASLFDAECPKTVKNFEDLAAKGYFDGQKFHRVVPDFVIQGGDPYTKTKAGPIGTGGPGYTIDCELKPALKHGKGALSMAHAGTCRHDKATGEKLSGRCSNGSQFFITHRATPHLDGVHTVFGAVTEGQAVVDQIVEGDVIVRVQVS